MPPITHLDNSPLQDAILEFQVSPLVDIVPDVVKGWDIPEYSLAAIAQSKQFSFITDFKTTSEVHTESAPIEGVVCRDESQGFIVHYMRDRFTINKKKPYTDFSHLMKEAQRLWHLYAESFKPDQITRIGLRYINEIVLERNVNYYLSPDVLPPITEQLNDSTNFYHRYEMENQPLNTNIQIFADKKEKKLFVDIDCYSSRPFSYDEESVWKSELPSLRDFKNRLFFQITSYEYQKECCL